MATSPLTGRRDHVMSPLRNSTSRTRSVALIQRVGSCSKTVFRGTRLQIARQGVHRLIVSLPLPLPENDSVPEKHLGSHSPRGSDGHRRRILSSVDVDSWRGDAALHVSCRHFRASPSQKRRFNHVTDLALVCSGRL